MVSHQISYVSFFFLLTMFFFLLGYVYSNKSKAVAAGTAGRRSRFYIASIFFLFLFEYLRVYQIICIIEDENHDHRVEPTMERPSRSLTSLTSSLLLPSRIFSLYTRDIYFRNHATNNISLRKP